MIPRYRFYIVYALLVAAALFVHTHSDLAVPTNRPLDEIPLRGAGWTMTGQTRFDERVIEVLKPTDYISRSYADAEGKRVSLYLGYHAGGPESGPIHSPKHCLPGSGWSVLNERTVSLPFGGKKINLVRSVYQNGEAREMFLYWFQVRGETLASEYALKLAEVKNSIFHNRRDAAFVRVSVPFQGDEEKAFETGKAFIETFYPAIEAVLPL